MPNLEHKKVGGPFNGLTWSDLLRVFNPLVMLALLGSAMMAYFELRESAAISQRALTALENSVVVVSQNTRDAARERENLKIRLSIIESKIDDLKTHP